MYSKRFVRLYLSQVSNTVNYYEDSINYFLNFYFDRSSAEVDEVKEVHNESSSDSEQTVEESNRLKCTSQSVEREINKCKKYFHSFTFLKLYFSKKCQWLKHINLIVYFVSVTPELPLVLVGETTIEESEITSEEAAASDEKGEYWREQLYRRSFISILLSESYIWICAVWVPVFDIFSSQLIVSHKFKLLSKECPKSSIKSDGMK